MPCQALLDPESSVDRPVAGWDFRLTRGAAIRTTLKSRESIYDDHNVRPSSPSQRDIAHWWATVMQPAAADLAQEHTPVGALEHDQQRVLRVVQPALAGMMDGSVSTLAPLFATALATRDAHTAFLVGLAAALGAGISMAFAEALSDDGSVTGRGNPWVRGLVEGAATFAGGIGHTLPFLLPDVRTAVPAASVVVAIELLVISWLRFHYFKMPLVRSALQVIVGGALVFASGVIIGTS